MLWIAFVFFSLVVFLCGVWCGQRTIGLIQVLIRDKVYSARIVPERGPAFEYEGEQRLKDEVTAKQWTGGNVQFTAGQIKTLREVKERNG